MSPVPRRLLALVLAVLLAGGACGGSGATFSPSGPCLADGRAPGAYPELEKLIPQAAEDAKPTSVDSGRSCSAPALGTFAAHDVHELRFAGATWDHGGGDAETVAVLSYAGAEQHPAWAEEFYEAGARAARNTDLIETDRATIAGRGVFRLRTLNGLSYQTVVVWPDASIVRVVLAAHQLGSQTTRADADAAVVRLVESVIGRVDPSATSGPASS